MTRAPLVSVVVAAYNMEKYVALAVRSALAQTYRTIEVRVIDDGSTDGTALALAQFAGDGRVHYHYQPNQGQARAKNRGIRESRGEFIAFLDADDLWRPDKLEKQMAALARHADAGVVYSDVSYIDGEGAPAPAPERQYHSGRITEQLFIDNFVNFPTALVRRECFTELGDFDETLPMGIDWDLWLRLSTRYAFVFLADRTAAYRIWPGQMSRDATTRFACTLRIMDAFLSRYRALLPDAVVAEAWAHTYTGQGRRLTDAGRRREALGFLAAALKRRPASRYAWKSVGRLLMGRP
jgi:glycosyltransferase involved in cell wall biosynthesis